jgi:hypothetical protein
MKKEPSIIGCVFAIVWLPLLLVANNIYHGFVLTKLWLWFIVPVFNLPVLSLPAAIGLSLIVSFLAKESNSKKGEAESLREFILQMTVRAMLIPTFALIIGWIVRQWM